MPDLFLHLVIVKFKYKRKLFENSKGLKNVGSDEWDDDVDNGLAAGWASRDMDTHISAQNHIKEWVEGARYLITVENRQGALATGVMLSKYPSPSPKEQGHLSFNTTMMKRSECDTKQVT